MRILFLSSSTTNLVVAIIIDGKITYQNINNYNQDMSSHIMVVLDEAFKTTNIKPEELDKIMVTNGPGSFTGIRIGLSVAKTMAYALNIPVTPISTLEMLASGSNEKVVSLIDARRGYVYAGGYDENLNNFMSDAYVLLDKVKDYHLVSEDNFAFALAKPKYDILKIVNKHINEDGVNPHLLNPNYLKETEAESKLHHD